MIVALCGTTSRGGSVALHRHLVTDTIRHKVRRIFWRLGKAKPGSCAERGSTRSHRAGASTLRPSRQCCTKTIRVQRLRYVASEYKCCPGPGRRRPGSKIAGAEPRFSVGYLVRRMVANLPRLTFIFMLTLLPNPSVKRTSNGLGPLQGQWLFSFRGPKPLASAYLKR